MNGLLRHSPSIHKGLSGAPPYPTKDLQVIIYNQTYEDSGTTYYRTSLGIGLPVISGTGLDTIIDFAPLSDARFDKGSYVGNSYGLPEYYNYPYVGIYYDATSEATRYHWKITDFAYAVILAQTIDEDIQNVFFLKAKATTNTSNEISSVDALYIYATSLADLKLSKMKRYIGIQADFYGENEIINGNFIDSNEDGLADNWNRTNPTTSIVTGNGHIGNAQRYDASADNSKLYQSSFEEGEIYLFNFMYRANAIFLLQNAIVPNIYVPSNTGNAIEFNDELQISNSFILRYYVLTAGNWFELSNLSAKKKYVNYYKS